MKTTKAGKDCFIVVHKILKDADYKRIINEIKTFEEEYTFENKRLILSINSPGGDITRNFFFLLEYLESLERGGVETIAVCSGEVNSTALLLAGFCKKRVAKTGTKFLIHDIKLNSSALRDVNQLLYITATVDRYIDLMLWRFKKAKKEIDKAFFLGKEIKFGTRKARQLGIIHKVV